MCPIRSHSCTNKDAPTGALNKANSIEVLNLFTQIHNEGQTVILVTHDKEAALRGNRILYLEDGRITGELNLGSYTDEKELNKNNQSEADKKAADKKGKNIEILKNRNDILGEWLKQKGW